MTRLKGGRELQEFLALLPKRIRNNALRSAMIAGARIIREEARANVPAKTGQLRKSIKTSSARVFEGGDASVKVKLKGRHAFVGVFLEYGVAPHYISAGDADLSARKLTLSARRGDAVSDTDRQALKINGKFITGEVLHPGFPARPFLRPALDRKADEAVRAIGARLKEYLSQKTGFTAPQLEVDEIE